MLSIYIHIPFCRAKCRYCGFYSTPYSSDVADKYLDALGKEVALHKDRLRAWEAGTVYLGGGTPSILSSEQLDRLFSLIGAAVRFSRNAEITAEANPDSLTSDILDRLKEHGVNRLSIGVQSFSDDVLKWLRRPHSSYQAQKALTLAREYGFDNINIDLIYGIPGLLPNIWTDTLNKTMEFRPEHVAAYSLSVDEGSMLSHEQVAGTVQLPDDDLVVQQYEDAAGMLERSGYQHYEISNFCVPSFECRHNLNYWQRGEYIGLGPAAWTFLDGKRSMNVADTGSYVSMIRTGGRAVQFEEKPTAQESLAESLALGLRLTCGIDLEQVSLQYGPDTYARVIERISESGSTGFYHLVGTVLRLTDRGRLFANDAVARILS